MAKSSLNILLLFDLSIPAPENNDLSDLMSTEEWKDEAILHRALRELGHEVRPIGLFDDLQPLFDQLKREPPDLIFNQCEAVHADRQFEPNLVALLELLKLKYTGAPPTAMHICKDKSLAKKILTFHRIHVPRFTTSHRSHPIRRLPDFSFPAFIKPLNLEASEGIAQVSFAESEEEALERVRYLHENVSSDVIIEEYIEGRELYVGVLGNQRLTVFPPRELFFREVPEGEPKFATYKAKWDDKYRKRWGIRSGAAASLPDGVEEQMIEACKKIYRLFQIRGYARIDFRLKPSGELFFIEANPNPSIARDDDFAKAAEKSGLSYGEMLSQIIQLAMGT
jgi:D-alanine-D-alanine ligase